MSEIRYDLIHDEYALIAPERLHRPDCYKYVSGEENDTRSCPFCEGHESMTPHEIYAIRENEPDTPGWKTRVVPNLYKAVQIEAAWESKEVGIYQAWEGLGAHEVIVDTPRHLTRMDAWTHEEYFNWLYTLRSRINDLKNDFRLVYFSLFKNHGHYGAATQSHPHTQLIALPIVPKRKMDQLLRAHRYFLERRHNIFESVLSEEEHDGDRIIIKSEHFMTICPFASTFAFEVMVISRESAASLTDLNDIKLQDLANVLKQTIDALYQQLGDFDFNITFNTPPVQKNVTTESFFDALPQMWRFGLRIVPRLFRLGGFEFGSGVHINPVSPEEAADLLRSVVEGKR
ncbi:galactose-1-phosphate uridylyltransferase [Hydrogenimonas sp.]|uniref:galactose-1-phosphate uridylyltransferase n=1 Tax=Hydrogenimonas sp. TaxID=2231112 RepID=UPI002609F1D6|nr:galactose-1-phosphate uridylyltransferase [Hydrogenimonas sp.]